MKKCHACQKEICLQDYIGREEQCPFCRADLHCCENCIFYAQGIYNDCRETQAERVVDKTRSNFCDFFQFRNTDNINNEKRNARDKLEALFKK